jgi:hypothetical protein
MHQNSASIDNGSKIRVNEPLTTKELARRDARRRSTYIAQAVSYLISAGILSLYAYAGTITIAVPIVYLICGIIATAIALSLSIFAAVKMHVFTGVRPHSLPARFAPGVRASPVQTSQVDEIVAEEPVPIVAVVRHHWRRPAA